MSQRRALIVASDEYDHEGLRQLLSPAADAEALARVLGDPQIGNFDVRVVHNETAHFIQAQIEDLFSDSPPDDVLLLHFSCHGLKSESGELFFAARNTRPNRLGSTAISADFVQRCMRASRSRSVVLLLDCCYGGAFGQGVTVRATGDVNVLDSFPGERLGGGRGRAVITASSSMEYAFEGDQLADDHSRRPSVFTTALVDGLATGEADRDEDGWVSLNELYDYVFDRVREQNPHQTPSRDVQMQGELYLARSQRRRIRPLPIPADLQAAMTDANMFTRLGAVTELRSRLTSDNLPVAAGARDALADIARTDIQYLAEAAATALREVAVRTAERELHFGQVAKDSSPTPRTVHLLGPPLAQACTFQASDSWIRIDETTEGIHVSVDTSQAGTLRGEITIKGPTGDAVILVDVEVTPGAEPPPPTSASPVDTAEPWTASATPSAATRRQSPEPMTVRPAGFPTNAPAESPVPPASVPRATTSAATPTRPPSPDGWHVPSRLTTVAAILVSTITVFVGLGVLVTLDDPVGASVALYVQLIFYGVLRLVQSLAAGQVESGRQSWLLIFGVLALLGVLGLLAFGAQLKVFIAVFWVIAGVIDVFAALRGDSRPSWRWEIVSGVLGASAGILATILTLSLASVEPMIITLGIWLILLGVLVLMIVFKQRYTLRRSAGSGAGSAGGDPHELL